LTSAEDEEKRFPGEFQAGDVVGGTYIVTDYIGHGAMGHVYQAKHGVLSSVYALKTVSKDKVTDLAWKRFQAEAQAIAIMNHPNIVSIYNLGLHEQVLPYYVMDVLKGVDLAHKLYEDGPMTPSAAAKLFQEICAGIAYAHSKGIIHRDIKPGNIFLLDEPDATGATVKIVDFGIAKITEARNQDLQSLTGVGDVVGTPYYMSPEQCKAMTVDGRSDIYSLGCVLYQVLTGSLPFRGRNPTETMLLHESMTPPTLSKGSGGKEFDKTIEYIVATCLAKDPDERYQKVEQLADDLKGMIEENAAATTKHLTALSAPTSSEPQPTVSQNAKVQDPSYNSAPTLYVTGAKVGRLQGRGIAKAAASALLVTVGAVVAVQSLVNKRVAQLNSSIARKDNQNTAVKQMSGQGAATGVQTGLQITGKTALTPTAPDKDADLPGHQIVSASLMIDKPYSSLIVENNISYRVFNFPSDTVIGLISSSSGGAMVRAVGQLRCPVDEHITFTPGEIAERYPKCLKRFSPGDIYCVKFNKSYCDDSMVAAVAGIPEVAMLDFELCWGMTPKCIDALNRFQKLKAFNSPYSVLDGDFLAKCNCWDKLEVFSTADLKKPLAMLKRLKSSAQLKRCIVKNSQLSEDAFRAISSLSQIEYLDLDGTYVTSKNLATLTSMNNLRELNIRNTTLDAGSADLLKQFKSLKMLYIQSEQLKAGNAEKLKVVLPGVKIL